VLLEIDTVPPLWQEEVVLAVLMAVLLLRTVLIFSVEMEELMVVVVVELLDILVLTILLVGKEVQDVKEPLGLFILAMQDNSLQQEPQTSKP
jgi:hypothetical protein